MILLFKEKSMNYWLTDTVVDCCKTEEPHELLDLEIVEYLDPLPSNNIDKIVKNEKSIIINNKNNDIIGIPIYKKLNKKVKLNKLDNINDSKYKSKYNRKDTETIARNTGYTTTENKDRKSKYKQKVSDFRVNDFQKTSEHKCLYKCYSFNNHEREMQKMRESSELHVTK
jgi:hypothetical protein